MGIERLIKEIQSLGEGFQDGVHSVHPEVSLLIIKSTLKTEQVPSVYDAAFCLILQGAKEVHAGSREIQFGAGECLIVSHEVPVISKISQAPYLALVLKIDISIIRSLYEEFGESAIRMNESRSLEVGEASEDLSDALLRLVKSSQNKVDRMVLNQQIVREVHFRLLQMPNGGMLRNFLQVDSYASSISRAISMIRERFIQAISVPEIARAVGMSTSSFHHYFKQITETTPLQFQKDLRLLEARRLITKEGEGVTSAALRVGYESPNQFSREYTRKFGVNPSAEMH